MNIELTAAETLMTLHSTGRENASSLGAMGIDFDLSRSDVENLLAGFLLGAFGVELRGQLMDLNDLPLECRKLVGLARDVGRAWTAMSTPSGPCAAWGDYDVQGSRRIFAYLLYIEWWTVPSGYHSLWCYCDPKRPTEWSVGRGRNNEPR